MNDGAQESKRISKSEAEMGKELVLHGARLDEFRRDIDRIDGALDEQRKLVAEVRVNTGSHQTVSHPNGRKTTAAVAGGGLSIGAFIMWLVQWLNNNFGTTP